MNSVEKKKKKNGNFFEIYSNKLHKKCLHCNQQPFTMKDTNSRNFS